MLALEPTKNSLEIKSFTLARLIGDLPCHRYDIDISTPVEKIVENLKEKPELPGIVLRQDGSFLGAMSRSKIF